MLFPSLELEESVQVNDKTRLNGDKSYVTQDETAVTLTEIDPDGTTGLIDVTTLKYLDWQYAASGSYTVTCRITTASASAEFTNTITVLTEATDKLFSTDADLKLHEPDILKWTEDGRNSFKNVHRRAQKLILEYIKREGFRDTDGDALTKSAMVDIENVKQWSTFISLRLIFEGLSNATDDVFSDKSKAYKGQEVTWRKTVLLGLDVDGDGVVDDNEGLDLGAAFVARR